MVFFPCSIEECFCYPFILICFCVLVPKYNSLEVALCSCLLVWLALVQSSISFKHIVMNGMEMEMVRLNPRNLNLGELGPQLGQAVAPIGV